METVTRKYLLCLGLCTLLGVVGCKSKTEQTDGQSEEKGGDRDVEKSEATSQKKSATELKAEKKAEEAAYVKKVILELQKADKKRLIAALEEKDHRIKKAAINRLYELKETSPEVIDALIPHLAHKKEKVRRVATRALTAAGAAAVAPLIDALRKDSPYAKKSFKKEKKKIRISHVIVLVLSAIKEQAVGPLVLALENDDEAQKITVIRALGHIGAPAKPGVPKLLELTKHSNSGISGVALVAIARIDPKNPKVVAAVKKGTSNPDKAVADKAQIAQNLIDNNNANPEPAK